MLTRAVYFVNGSAMLACCVCSWAAPDQQAVLAHLLLVHKLVFSRIERIADLGRYLGLWRERLAGSALEAHAVVIKDGEQTYYLIDESLPEDKAVREAMHRDTLVRFGFTTCE